MNETEIYRKQQMGGLIGKGERTAWWSSTL